MLRAFIVIALVAMTACTSRTDATIDDRLIDREALVDPDDWISVPAFLAPLIRDAEFRIARDPDYDLSCLEFLVGYHEKGEDGEGDEYFVLVSHSKAWLRANGHISESNGEVEGGLSYCGSDVAFEYSRTGKFLRKVYQR